VLVAFVNGIALFAIAAWIVLEASRRIYAPVQVVGGLMFWVAVAGLAVNVIVFAILRTGDAHNLNIRARSCTWSATCSDRSRLSWRRSSSTSPGGCRSTRCCRWSWRSSSSAPRGTSSPTAATSCSRARRRASTRGRSKEDLRAALPYVIDVHHVHAWSISEERPMVTLHAKRRGRHELVHRGARDQTDARAALPYQARHRRDRVRRLRRRPGHETC